MPLESLPTLSLSVLQVRDYRPFGKVLAHPGRPIRTTSVLSFLASRCIARGLSAPYSSRERPGSNFQPHPESGRLFCDCSSVSAPPESKRLGKAQLIGGLIGARAQFDIIRPLRHSPHPARQPSENLSAAISAVGTPEGIVDLS